MIETPREFQQGKCSCATVSKTMNLNWDTLADGPAALACRKGGMTSFKALMNEMCQHRMQRKNQEILILLEEKYINIYVLSTFKIKY